MDFCADRRSKPKIPKHVVLIEEWPKTSNGKIMKQPPRERLMHEASLLAVRR
jgi:acyl-CoA synthetase (AMP-forming)/AMP-acid ligase II